MIKYFNPEQRPLNCVINTANEKKISISHTDWSGRGMGNHPEQRLRKDQSELAFQ